jgi:hypothetical protein
MYKPEIEFERTRLQSILDQLQVGEIRLAQGAEEVIAEIEQRLASLGNDFTGPPDGAAPA